MLELIRSREYAADAAYKLQSQLTRIRNSSLAVSSFRDVGSKHQGGVISLDLDAAENRYLLSGGSDGQLGIYDMYSSVTSMNYTHPAICFVDINHPNVHQTAVSSVTWYPHDSGMFLSCGTDNLLKVWDTNELIAVEEHRFSGIAYCVAMSSRATSHSLAAVATEKSEVLLVDLKSGSRSHTLRGHKGAVLCTQWSKSDEFIIASGGRDGHVLLWDIRKARACILVLDKDNNKHMSSDIESKHRAHSGKVNGLHFTSDGQHIVTMGTDFRLRLWDAHTGRKRPAHFGHHDNQSRRHVQICAAGNVVYAPEAADIQSYDVTSGDMVRTLEGHYTKSNCCVYNESRQEVYSGGNDRNILIFSADSAAERRYKEYLEGSDEGTEKPAERSMMRDHWSSDSDDSHYNPG